jgi:hypothetical protein
MFMKKLVLITALFSLSSICAIGEDKPENDAVKYFKELAPKAQSAVQNFANWADVQLKQVDELVKNNPRKALVISAVTGAILRKTTLVAGAGYGLYQLTQRSPQNPEEEKNSNN